MIGISSEKLNAQIYLKKISNLNMKILRNVEIFWDEIYGLLHTVKLRVLARVTNLKIRFLGVFEYETWFKNETWFNYGNQISNQISQTRIPSSLLHYRSYLLA